MFKFNKKILMVFAAAVMSWACLQKPQVRTLIGKIGLMGAGR